MSNNRQDSWTEQEDLLLAETVLRCIREGRTQLAAFEEVGKQLSRTSAACGFRWNSLIRKQYGNDIRQAKLERKELNKAKKKKSNEIPKKIVKANVIDDSSPKPEISLIDVINFLKGCDVQGSVEADLAEAKKQNAELSRSLDKLKADYKLIQEDYKALISIMDRAKRFITLDNGDTSDLEVDPLSKLEIKTKI